MPLRMIPISRRDSDASSECSYGSYLSGSTAPTDCSIKTTLRHFDGDISRIKPLGNWDQLYCGDWDSRLSVDSCASTIASEEDPREDEELVYEEPTDLHCEPSPPTAYATTPSEFARYFPSTRRLRIRHDDTIDGNMNLRVDTETHTRDERKVDLTLFHLRMHDLKSREFSLRRYCRDSGREICHSSRKYTKAASQRRPTFQRSMSSALASLRYRASDKSSVKSWKRHDSGYASMKGDGDAEATAEPPKRTPSKNLPIPTNTTMLEFANYAHIELKRRGAKSSKRYEFDYWGTSYTWRRSVKKHTSSKEISYHLFVPNSPTPIAHIVPEPMSPFEVEEEERKGGWIPRSSMWLSDPKIMNALTDVAEYVLLPNFILR